MNKIAHVIEFIIDLVIIMNSHYLTAREYKLFYTHRLSL
jgi:hypothetical protein